MKDMFETYYNTEIERVKSIVADSVAARYFKNKSQKKLRSNEEFLCHFNKALEANTQYNYLLSEKGKTDFLKHYKENKEAINSLIEQGIKLSESRIMLEKTCIFAKRQDLSNLQNYFSFDLRTAETEFVNFLKTQQIFFLESPVSENEKVLKVRKIPLNPSTVIDFIELYDRNRFKNIIFSQFFYCGENYAKAKTNALSKKAVFNSLKGEKQYKNIIKQRLFAKNGYAVRYSKTLYKMFPVKRIMEILKENPFYTKTIDSLTSKTANYLNLQENILNMMPENYIDFYPNARKMKRHFILHLGPTNSGKTFQAIESLKKCSNGVYLAPLRLLAYEQFENLNLAEVMCDLLTGEEEIRVPFATHISSTIEMLDINKHYDVAVIDEAQMIADTNRGNSWTRAVLGVCADEVHICAAKHAEKILKRLIEECGDTYEVIYTERHTPLVFDNSKTFKFPDDVHENDALIVFSRKDVHKVANILKEKNIECSLIYGNLPYDVRHKEAEKFNTGITQVVVSTDAIGMGLNMPIKRVVFLKTTKFDGFKIRTLEADEIQQIAGRAGRYGIYNKGYFQSLEFPWLVKEKMEEDVPDIKKAVVSFSPILLDLDIDLSRILKKWNTLKEKPGYAKADITREIQLCEVLESYTNQKQIIYDLITIPFSEKIPEIYDIWYRLSKKVINNDKPSLHDYIPKYNKNTSLQNLEKDYQICDILFYFYSRFWKNKEDLKEIVSVKKEISDLTIKVLSHGDYS